MSLSINNNIHAVNGYRNLNRNDAALGLSLQRLSSGLRIGKASDDAAGLVISEQMRAQIKGLDRSISSTETAVNLVQTAEGALDEVNTLLKKMRELSLHASNIAPNDTHQRAADQAELDNAIESITRIASTTQFGTKKLLDGTLAAANSYDTTRIHRFDVGAALLTRSDFIPGTVSLVIDSSAETNTFLRLSGAVSFEAGSTVLYGVTSALADFSLTDMIEQGMVGGGTSMIGSFFDSTNIGYLHPMGASTMGVVMRIEDVAFSFSTAAGQHVATTSIVSFMNEVQKVYSFNLDASGLAMVRVSTGAVGALRDLEFGFRQQMFTGLDTIAKSFTITFSDATSTALAGGLSLGHNQATVLKTSGLDFMTGFSVAGGSQGDTGTVFILANGSVLAGSTLRQTLGDGTNRLNNGASLTMTLAGKDFTFSNNESITDMVSYINNEQAEYYLDSDRDYGLTLVRTRIGTDGQASDLRIRVTDATGRQSNMVALSTTEVDFSTTSPGTGGIDNGVNITAHLEGPGLPGGRINLSSSGDDASILSNNATGLKIDVSTSFAKQAGTVVANLSRGAIFQVGPGGSELTAVDIKDISAVKLGLGGDRSGVLRSIESLTDSQALMNGLTKQALDVIDQAISDVTDMRGALGAFQANTLETNLGSLRISHENLTSAESTIRDTDFAHESATFAKQQILMNSSNSMLAQANQLPQAVLQLFAR